MNNRNSGIIYAILGLYTLLISWHYNHSWILLLIHWIFWPIYLVYELLIGHLSHDLWRTIPESFFK
jgi:membrane associated rhomboid family serine protease